MENRILRAVSQLTPTPKPPLRPPLFPPLRFQITADSGGGIRSDLPREEACFAQAGRIFGKSVLSPMTITKVAPKTKSRTADKGRSTSIESVLNVEGQRGSHLLWTRHLITMFQKERGRYLSKIMTLNFTKKN